MSKLIIGVTLFILSGCTATRLSAPSEQSTITLKSTTGIVEPDLSEAYSKFNGCLSAIDLTQSVSTVNEQIMNCRETFHANAKP